MPGLFLALQDNNEKKEDKNKKKDDKKEKEKEPAGPDLSMQQGKQSITQRLGNVYRSVGVRS